MKITTLSQLDELVAKELGYVFYEEQVDFYGEFITNYCWIPPDVNSKDYSKHLNHFVYNDYFQQYQGICPRFSTNVVINQELINHIHSIDYLELCTHSNKLNCCATIYQMDKDFIEVQQYWDSTCGEHYTNTMRFTIDSPINSLSLAICLAFLKYKGIEVELEINDNI